jgi:putative glutamine amidotransferase
MVNGGHSQAVKKLSNDLRAVAVADDGIVEAFEGKGKGFVLGIQFHAELILHDSLYFEVIKKFLKKAKK